MARLRRVPDLVWLLLGWLPVAALQVAPWSRGNGLDDLAYVAPNQRVTLDAWLSGHLPLWNPYVFGGSPHLGNLQTAALYPFHLISAPFPDLLGQDVEVVLHVLLLGVGWWWLGRRLGLARSAAVAMGVASMWIGSTIARSGALAHLPPLAWAPVLMGCIHLVLTRERPWRAVAATAVVTWCVIGSGHPQSILMSATLVSAWTVGAIVEHRAWRRLGHLAAAAGLALMMAAPPLFAIRQGVGGQYVTERSLDSLRTPGWSFRFHETATLLFGQPLRALAATFSNGEVVAYVGAVLASFAVVGLVAAVRRRAVSAWCTAAVGLFALALTYGPASPVLRAARRLPGFDQPRVSARWSWVVAMAVVLLAGYGIDALRRRHERRDVWWLAGAAAAVVLVGLVTSLDAGGSVRNLVLWLAAVAAVGVAWWSAGRVRTAAIVAVVVLAAVELLVPVVRLQAAAPGGAATSSSQLQGEAVRYLSGRDGLAFSITNEEYDEGYMVGGMRPNAHVLGDVRSIDGYDGGVWVSTRWVAAALQLVGSVNDLTLRAQIGIPLDADRMARLGVRAVLYDPDRGPAEGTVPGWIQVPLDDEFEVWENPAWEGDVTVWYRTELVADPLSAGTRIRGSFDEVRGIGLVESPDAVLDCTSACDPDHTMSESPRAGIRSATVDAQAPAVVAFAEQYDEGWTVTVDGEDATVIAVDGVWAGVQVPAGTHTIELRYRPSWLVASLVVMLLGLLIVIALAITPTLAPRLGRWSEARSAARPPG